MTITFKDKIFYLAIAGFVGGVFLHSFVHFGQGFSLFFILLGSSIFFYGFLQISPLKETARGNALTVLAADFLLSAGLGIWRYAFADRALMRSLDTQLGKTVILEGVIADEPDVREANTRLVLRVDSEDIHTKVLLTASLEPQ